MAEGDKEQCVLNTGDATGCLLASPHPMIKVDEKLTTQPGRTNNGPSQLKSHGLLRCSLKVKGHRTGPGRR